MNAADLQNFGPNWLIILLPYMEQGPLYETIANSVGLYPTTGDNGWRSVISTIVPSLRCASDDAQDVPWAGITGYGDWARGNYGCNAFGVHQSGENGWTDTLGGAVPLASNNPVDHGVPTGTAAGGVMCIN